MRGMRLVISITLILALVLAGCNKIENNINTAENISAGGEGDSLKSGENEAKTSKSIVYTNTKLGFTLDFPQSWEGNYIIKEYDEDFIGVHFIGQSEMGRGEDNDGLFMFYIGTEDALAELFADGNTIIGTANGRDFYYATGTDYPLSSLDLSSDETLSEMIKDENERKLMQDDFAKAKQMEADIENIIKTFKPI